MKSAIFRVGAVAAATFFSTVVANEIESRSNAPSPLTILQFALTLEHLEASLSEDIKDEYQGQKIDLGRVRLYRAHSTLVP